MSRTNAIPKTVCVSWTLKSRGDQVRRCFQLQLAQSTTHGTTLQTVDEAKYLGVTIHGKLNWKPHVNNICKKANITQGFLGRNLRNCTPKVNEQVYRTYVLKTNPRICLNPSTDLLATQIGMVQRRAARFAQSDYRRRHSITAMLQQLSWQTII